MKDLIIKVENETIENAFKNFIINYKTNVADYMNQLVGNDGSPCDSEVAVVDDTITVYHIAPDKGFVLGEVTGEKTPFQVMPYADLAVDMRYLLPEQGRMSLFLKQATGEVDIRLGAFKTLKDASTEWDSEPVKAKIAEAHDWKKARMKDLKRAQKLGKAPVEDAQVVSSNE